jgi:hypothetical protein
MRRWFAVKYFYLMLLLIGQGLLKFSLPTTSLDCGFDLNLPPPLDEQASTMPSYPVSPDLPFSASRDNHNLSRDKKELVMASSAGVSIPISPCSNIFNKQKCWNLHGG